jgi:signal transduction histidine kinase
MVEDITEKRTAQEELQKSETNLQRLAGHLIQAQEEERQRIARELHDDISQRLAMLHVDLQRLDLDLPDSAVQIHTELQEQLKRVSEIASDIQTILHRLHPSKLHYLGIVATAKSFCTELSAHLRMEIDFDSENIPHEIPEEISLCVFRVLQEALQNASKHSGSRHVQVSLVGGLNEIQLTVRDSGIGFDPEDTVKGPGLGLTSMKERLRLVNGNLSIDSQLQRGTTIRARVPLSSKAKSAGQSL